MNIQNRSLDTYTAFQSQAERFGSLRVAPPPRRSEEPAGITTANGESATNNPVELGAFGSFAAMLQQEVQNISAESTGESSLQSRIRDIEEQTRSGTYRVDATATASRLNALELLLR